MKSIRPISPGFQSGEPVALAQGTYEGTRGVFLSLRDDVKWADIAESGGAVRSHPVAWLDHSNRTAAR